MFNKIASVLLLILAALTIGGCGGSGGGSSSVPTTTVNGTVFAGPAAGATVTVKTVNGAVVATSTISDSSGNFTVAVPTAALSSDLIFEAGGSGATFTDEATGATTPLGTLSAHVPAGTLTAGSQVTLDPASTILQKLIAGGKSRSAAFTVYSSSFGYKPNSSTVPVFANISTSAATAQRLAGFRAAAFSQLTKDVKDQVTGSGIGSAAKQFELLQAIADDLSDGKLDGKKNGASVVTASNFTIPEDILNQYNTSLVNFQNSANNHSKLTASQINAPVPGLVSLTPTYRVEYVPPAGGEVNPKVSFQLKISKRSDGSPATGLASSIVLNPYMVMGAMGGGSNFPGAVVESSTPGTYNATVYYSMETWWGMDMYWKLYVFVGVETAPFYPNVAPFPMMDTAVVSLYNAADTTTGTSGSSTKRRYRIWRDSLAAESGNNGLYDLTVYVTAPDGYSSYYNGISGLVASSNLYPVYAGRTWTTPSAAVNTVTVQAYIGNAWVTLTPVVGSNGRYTATGLNLAAGANSVYFRLLVNGTTYTNTSAGPAWDASNATTSNAVQKLVINL